MFGNIKILWKFVNILENIAKSQIKKFDKIDFVDIIKKLKEKDYTRRITII